jgi:protease I
MKPRWRRYRSVYTPQDIAMTEATLQSLATDGFEQSERLQPQQALDGAGATTQVISLKDGDSRGWNHPEWGERVHVDQALNTANARKFDALLLPGGVMNPDSLRLQPAAVKFVRSCFDADKPVAAICHGPWTIVESGAARGYRMTSWPSLRTDITHAGGEWVDQEVAVDDNLVTSRKPEDLPAFKREMLALFSHHRAQRPPQ